MQISSNNIKVTDPESSLWAYCGMDSTVTLMVWERMQKGASVNALLSYDFVSGMRAPALEMALRGIRVDMEQRAKLIDRYTKDKNRLQVILDTLAMAVWNKGLNSASPTQMKSFFYDCMKLPPVFKNDKGQRKLTTNREALEKLSVHFYAQPICNTCMALRDVDKTLQFLRTGLSAENRFHTSFNVVGTETGRWCLTGDHEVLTLNGWIKIKDWDENSHIVVATKDRLFLDKAKKFEFKTDKIVKINTDRLSCVVTPEHKIPYIDSHGDFRTAKASEGKLLSRAILGLPFEFNFVPEVETRLYVMTQADGHLLNSKWVRFHFAKQRKIDRCKKLLTEAGIYFEENEHDTTTYILADSNRLAHYKEFTADLLHHNPKVFTAELLFWDGDGEEYTTTNSVAADWAATMIHLAGKSATIRFRVRAELNWKNSYRVRPQKNNVTRVQKADYKFEDCNETVYCAETNTGFFLVRYNGAIHVTGNSSSADTFDTGGNEQNITDDLRVILISDEGKKFGYFDMEQAESYVVAYRSGDKNYINAIASGDLHTAVARMCWPAMPWKGNIKDDRKIADQIYYRHFTYRDIAKRLGHATNYNGSARELAKRLKIPEEVVIEFQRAYFAAFPGIRVWHHWVAKELQTKGYLITALGRKRNFLGRRFDDSTLREAIAHEPQSTVGELLNLFLYRVWRDAPTIGVTCMSQIHDAILIQYPQEQEDIIIPKIKPLGLTPVTYPSGIMTIPIEAKTGWNFASASDTNLHGLIKYKGTDVRIPPIYKGILDWQVC